MAKKKNQNETTDEQAEIRPLTPEEAKEAAEMADAPDLTEKEVVIDAAYVDRCLADIAGDHDVSRFIL